MIKNNSEKIREIFKELNSNTKKSKNTIELKIPPLKRIIQLL